MFAAAYGLDAPARYSTLARALDVDAPTPSVGRGTSVIVDEPALPRTSTPLSTGVPSLARVSTEPTGPIAAAATSVLAPIAPGDATMKMAVADLPTPDPAEPPDAAEPATDEHGRQRRLTMLGVNPNRAVTEAGVAPGEPPLPFALTMLAPLPKGPAGPVRATIRKPIRAETAPLEDLGKDSPLPIARARELLATAADRDAVFLTLLRAARSRARYAGLLTVQGGAAIGRLALAESGIDISGITGVLIPLDAISPFRAAVTNQQPHVGPITAGEPAIDQMTRRFGGTTPTSALLLPIVLRGRTVAIVVAHRLIHDLKLVDITELLPLASATSDALSRLIVKHKAAGYRAPTDQAIVAIEADQVDTKRISRDSGPWRAPDGETEPPSLTGITAGLGPTVPTRHIDDVIDQIERAGEGEADAAINDAVERAPEALGALMKRFPGRLRVDRFSVSGRALRAAQYGGLLELVVRLGTAAAELLIDKMSAAQRDVRFYATACAAELRPRSAVYALVERVFDQDFGVRAMAIEALSGYPSADLGTAMSRAPRRPLDGSRGRPRRDGRDHRARRHRGDRRSDRRRGVGGARRRARAQGARRADRAGFRRERAQVAEVVGQREEQAPPRVADRWPRAQGRRRARVGDQRPAAPDRRVLRLPPRPAEARARGRGGALGLVVARVGQPAVRRARGRALSANGHPAVAALARVRAAADRSDTVPVASRPPPAAHSASLYTFVSRRSNPSRT